MIVGSKKITDLQAVCYSEVDFFVSLLLTLFVHSPCQLSVSHLFKDCLHTVSGLVAVSLPTDGQQICGGAGFQCYPVLISLCEMT